MNKTTEVVIQVIDPRDSNPFKSKEVEDLIIDTITKNRRQIKKLSEKQKNAVRPRTEQH